MLARGATPAKPLPSAPLPQFGWSYAREVDANLLEMPSGESERFLFYRGLGEFDLPVKVAAGAARQNQAHERLLRSRGARLFAERES